MTNNSEEVLSRLTVDLSPTRKKKLRLLASQHDVSMAEMMRLIIDRVYDDMVKPLPAMPNFFNK